MKPHREQFAPDDRMDAALNVLLVLSVLLALGSVGYAITVPKQASRSPSSIS